MNYSKLTKKELLETMKEKDKTIQEYASTVKDFEQLKEKHKVTQTAVKEQTKAFTEAKVVEAKLEEMKSTIKQVKKEHAEALEQLHKAYKAREENYQAQVSQQFTAMQKEIGEQGGVMIDMFDIIDHELESTRLYYNKFKKVFIKEKEEE